MHATTLTATMHILSKCPDRDLRLRRLLQNEPELVHAAMLTCNCARCHAFLRSCTLSCFPVFVHAAMLTCNCARCHASVRSCTLPCFPVFVHATMLTCMCAPCHAHRSPSLPALAHAAMHTCVCARCRPQTEQMP